MKEAGQVIVFRFPQTDLEEGKLRPALLLGKLPGNYDDWLICMISVFISKRANNRVLYKHDSEKCVLSTNHATATETAL